MATKGLEYRFREARLSDVSQVTEIIRASIVQICGPAYRLSDDGMERWLSNKTDRNTSLWMRDHNNHMIVCEESQSGALVGVGLSRWEQGNEFGEVLLCYIRPDRLGIGVGSGLLRSLEQWIRVKATTVHLCSTLNAANFYFRHQYSAYQVELGEPVSIRMIKTL